MKRRTLTLALSLPLLCLPILAQALDIQPYSAARLQQAQTADQAVALHFHAAWCPTCRAQEQSLKALQSDAALQATTVLVVDYDNERDLKRALGVRSQSTLIVYKGRKETARLAGETQASALKTALLSAR